MRYVLLKHENHGDFHVDFLLDSGEERLLSWQITDKSFANNIVGDEKSFDFTQRPNSIDHTLYSYCRRIFDHRRKYLDFSGNLGEHRGYVNCVENGIWELLEQTASRFVIKTVGTRLADNSPVTRQWRFEPPDDMTLTLVGTSPVRLLSQLPPPGEENWVVLCRFLC